MELRPLGRTGLRISPLGLGTVKFGRNRGVRYPRAFTVPDERTVAGLLAQARDEGINLLDTAPAYGTSEERLGRLLGSRRDDWVIVGKCGEEFAGGCSTHDFSPPALERQVARSLARLGTDRLDVLLLHAHGDDAGIVEREDGLGTLRRLQRAGMARHVGISAKTVAGARAALARGAEVLMIEFDAAAPGDRELAAAAAAAGAGVLVKKALASGHLRRLPGADPVAGAFRRVLSSAGISGIVVGTIDAAHLRANARAARAAVAASA